jgi:hypothetical protein
MTDDIPRRIIGLRIVGASWKGLLTEWRYGFRFDDERPTIEQMYVAWQAVPKFLWLRVMQR